MAALCLHRAGVAALSAVSHSSRRTQGRQHVSSSLFTPKLMSPAGLGPVSPLAPLKAYSFSRAVISCSAYGHPRTLTVSAPADLKEQLLGAKEAIRELIQSKYCNPILVRLGWHDAGTYDKDVKEAWPVPGGATASIRLTPELDHAANAGLANALALLAPIKDKYPGVSYADLFQLASATAVEVAGGPKIPMKFGRMDATTFEHCTPDGRLPDADPPSPADHLRKVFYRMGLNDQEIVALSGAHTLGRARPERSGFGKKETKYTKDGPGAPGGSSWTVDWLKFDNSYFKDIKAQTDEELLVLPTDAVLFQDPQFKVFAEKYAEDEAAFFADYALAHKKLSELGAKFDPPEGIVLDEPQKFRAADYSSGKKDFSDTMKEKMRAEYISIGGSPDQALTNNPFLIIISGISILAILAWLSGAI